MRIALYVSYSISLLDFNVVDRLSIHFYVITMKCMHACIIMMMGVHTPPTNHGKLEGSGLAEGLAGREKWLEDSVVISRELNKGIYLLS